MALVDPNKGVYMSTEKPARVTKKAAILEVYASGVTKAADILAALEAKGVQTTLSSIQVTISKFRKETKATAPND
jgi:hypothetical protein